MPLGQEEGEKEFQRRLYRIIVKWVWEVHVRHGGDPCPFNIDEAV